MAALRIIQEQNWLQKRKVVIIFGSSFPHDQEYTQICSNINRIKIAMEIGETVILCNLSNLYESLYDALNQSYSTYGGKRFVDLGLGTHRVKCRVHETFRLIVIAEDTEVFENFPVPLINRFEKHFLGMHSLTCVNQKKLVNDLKRWLLKFCQLKGNTLPLQLKENHLQPGDAFVGYHEDVVPSLILHHSDENLDDGGKLLKVKQSLLWCATPEAICRLEDSELKENEKDVAFKTYFNEQKHDCLASLLTDLPQGVNLVQVTTGSRLLTKSYKKVLATDIRMQPERITMISLKQVSTEDQFVKKIKTFLSSDRHTMLLIQTEASIQGSQNLIDCVRYNIQEQVSKMESAKVVVLILYVPKVAGGCFTGFCVHPWFSCHVDELQRNSKIGDIYQMKNKPVHDVLREQNLVDFDELLTECLPLAACNIEEHPERLERRLEILSKATDDPEFFTSFFKSAQRMVVNALEQKSETVPHADRWLSKLATTSDYFKEGKTFLQAIWAHLLTVITPQLQEILAFLDLDQSLELVTSKTPWILEVLNGLMSNSTSEEVSAARIYGSKEAFQCQFPLARYLVSVIDAWQLQDDGQIENCDGNHLHAVFEAHPMSKTLAPCFCTTERKALLAYIHDVVQIKLKSATLVNDQVTEFLCIELLKYSRWEFERRQRKNANEIDNEPQKQLEAGWSDYISPIDVHVAFSRHKQHLTFLTTLCHFQPNLPLRTEGKLKDGMSDCQICTTCFSEVMVAIKPDHKSLGLDKKREEWISKVKKAGHLFEQLKSICSTSPEGCEEIKIQSNLRGFQIIQTYLSHVTCFEKACSKDMQNQLTESVCRRIPGLHNSMRNNDLKSEAAFNKLLTFLGHLMNDVRNDVILKEEDPCILCKRKSENDPVKLPCGHWGCLHCLIEYFEDKAEDARICPDKVCKETILHEYNLHIMERPLEVINTLNHFKQSVSTFFLDVLQAWVFHDTPPDRSVVHTLMKLLVTEHLPEGSILKSKGPAPENPICLSPITRYFFLQLMLLTKEFNDAQDCLQSCLQQEKTYVKDMKSYRELLVLVIFTLEDRLFRDDNNANSEWGQFCVISKAMAHDYMKECLNSRRFKEELNAVLDVSKARLALGALSKSLIKAILKQQLTPEEKEFLDAMVLLVSQHPQTDCLKKFLTRLVVAQHSRALITEWKQSKIVPELLPHQIAQDSGTENIIDTTLVLGQDYIQAKEILLEMLQSHDSKLTHEHLQGRESPMNWILAGHRIHMTEDISKRDIARLLNVEMFKNNFPGLCNIEKIFLPYARDEIIEGHPCIVVLNQRDEAILATVMHLRTVLKCVKNKGTLIAELAKLATDPQTIRFFPTMPQDDTVEVTRAAGGVTRWYDCSNCGNIYGIGDCGRPVEQSNCPQCKAPIGAEKRAEGGHVYNRFVGTDRGMEQTAELNIRDRTQEGHILGEPNNENVVVIGERGLSGLEVQITRYASLTILKLDP